MNSRSFLTAVLSLALAACDKPRSAAPAPQAPAAKPDVPVLPVSKGDVWIYRVRLTIPADVTSPGAAEVNTRHERIRTYIGKAAAAQGLPETDCFEVTVPGSPAEREFVRIENDRVRPETTKPMWLDQPVPFFQVGMIPGTKFPEVSAPGNAFSRNTEDIAVEDIKAPAGTFNCHRLLTTGNDGEVELRKTVWFSPGNGIIREEKTRYRREKLLFRETQELTELKRASK